jgi:hypothetical protein
VCSSDLRAWCAGATAARCGALPGQPERPEHGGPHPNAEHQHGSGALSDCGRAQRLVALPALPEQVRRQQSARTGVAVCGAAVRGCGGATRVHVDDPAVLARRSSVDLFVLSDVFKDMPGSAMLHVASALAGTRLTKVVRGGWRACGLSSRRPRPAGCDPLAGLPTYRGRAAGGRQSAGLGYGAQRPMRCAAF